MPNRMPKQRLEERMRMVGKGHDMVVCSVEETNPSERSVDVWRETLTGGG